MIILDTNVMSALMGDIADTNVSAWLDRQPKSSIWTTSVTVFEIRYGLNIMARGRRRHQREAQFQFMILIDLQSRVLSYDTDAAEKAAALMAQRKLIGRPIDLRDTMIAGIALSYNATLATGNVRHFGDVGMPLINPWQS